MLSLLQAAQPFLGKDGFAGIRISTRPDAVDEPMLDCLQQYGVNAIELGAQSMSDRVLSATGATTPSRSPMPPDASAKGHRVGSSDDDRLCMVLPDRTTSTPPIFWHSCNRVRCASTRPSPCRERCWKGCTAQVNTSRCSWKRRWRSAASCCTF